MITLTKEWLLKTIAELEEERDAVPGVVNEDAAKALAAMKLALASLEAEPVAQVLSSRAGNDTSTIDKTLPEGTTLFTAQPAPVVPDEREAFNAWNNDTDCPLAGRDAKTAAWLAWCRRAAMLQGAEPVTTAYKLRDAVDAIRNSGIAIDGEKILAERDALNSPVIPDGWVACSERMPSIGVPVITCCGDVVQYAAYAWDGKEWQDWYEEYDKLPASTFTHWHPRPAAPQQEAKNV